MARILYLHGLYSKPGGVKPTAIRSWGHDVINPHLPDDDFELSCQRAQQALESGDPDLVIGSSRGGAVAIAIDSKTLPVILIAPAWKKWGKTGRIDDRSRILHSANDEVIPIEDSLELLQQNMLSNTLLERVGQDHAMTDPEALDALRMMIADAVS